MGRKQTSKRQLGLAGEFAVCSELSRRELNVARTEGNAEAVDILVSSDKNPGRCVTIQVKTTDSSKAVTNIFRKYATARQRPHPDFWVVVRFAQSDIGKTQFFILTHTQMGRAQKIQNHMGKWAHISTGCDSISISNLHAYEGKWDRIVSAVKGKRG